MSHSDLIQDVRSLRQQPGRPEDGQSDRAERGSWVAARMYAAAVICLLSVAMVGWLFLLGWLIKRVI